MPTFTRVLCPIDFSESSARAIRYADAIAGWYGATLCVQHVYVPLVVPVPGLPEAVEVLDDDTRERLGEQARAFVADLGCTPTTIVVDSGRPDEEILARAARRDADLVVMGTHGESGFRHLLLGSVTEKVLRQLACPVLTVPPHVEVPSRGVPFLRIVVGVDFSDWSASALALALSLAAPVQATVIAVHTVEWPWPEPPAPSFDELPAAQAQALQEYRRYVTDRASHRLEALLADRTPAAVRVETVIAHGKPHVELLRVAEERGADLVALGVHGRGTIDQAVFGSTTNHVVRHARCPVLTVRG